MERKTYTICGRTHVAVKVASCAGGVYTNYQNPKRKK